MSTAHTGASSALPGCPRGAAPLAAKQLEAALTMPRGGADAAGPGPVAGLRPLGYGVPLRQWMESSTTPPHPLLLPRREKTSQQGRVRPAGLHSSSLMLAQPKTGQQWLVLTSQQQRSESSWE